MTDWPAGLPQYVLRDGYAEMPQTGSIRSNMDTGPAKTRRRFTATVRKFQISLQLADSPTCDILDTFYRDTLGDGSVSFNWVHPRSRVAAVCKISKEPTIVADGYAFRAQFEMEILP